jgi:hypothetical protein
VQDAKSAARHTTATDVMHPGTMLLDAVRQWPTPRATEGEKGGPNGRDGSGSAHLYPTPAATEYGSSQNGQNAERPSGGTESLWQAASRGSLPGGAGVLRPSAEDRASAKLLRLAAREKAWTTKLKRAETALAKIRKSKRYYEKQIAVAVAAASAQKMPPR